MHRRIHWRAKEGESDLHSKPNKMPSFLSKGIEVKQYKYYTSETYGLDYEGMVEDLRAIPDGSIMDNEARGSDPLKQKFASSAFAANAQCGHRPLT